MIRRLNNPCYEVSCSCGAILGEEEACPCHFGSEDDAKHELVYYGWQISPDGKVTCAACLEEGWETA